MSATFVSVATVPKALCVGRGSEMRKQQPFSLTLPTTKGRLPLRLVIVIVPHSVRLLAGAAHPKGVVPGGAAGH